ncbi:MAG: EAL domain-containing protein [Campylobacterota bacterium]|nr:EAL domain-containing protein [Campylobacterota bacterium]
MKSLFNLKVLTIIGWTLMVLSSLVFAAYNQYQHSYNIAIDVAKANFDKDQAYRQWASSHGGVYVPVDMNRTPPSPYLSHIKERDIATESGKKLTLMNPAYMLRQMIDEYSGSYGAKGHITALEILNPKSSPDEWEKQALLEFREDPSLEEKRELIEIDGESYMRLMRPMKITEGCLKCHGHQATYRDTETAGGVSVSIPMDEIYKHSLDSYVKTSFIYFMFWIIGLIFIHFVHKKEIKAKKELKYFASHDSLTTLPNRHAYNNKINEIIESQNVNKFFLLFMDLDNFKTVNDSLGHSVGDLLLKGVAKRLSNRINGYEMFARFGGDEFVFLFTNVNDSRVVEAIAKQIEAALKEPFMLKDNEVYTAASIGISSYPENGNTSDMVLKNADIAMYDAKSSGRSRYSFYSDEMTSESTNYLMLESELHRALEKSELFLDYQPQISLKSEKLVGVEALIRWNHPRRGIVSPIEFISIAENNGLIMPIGEWIIDEACEQLAIWKNTDMKDITISINISAKQVLHQDLYSYIETAVEREAVDVSLLELEITETVVMENINETIKILAKLKKLGVSIAIDDFGTGYSSLSYLKKLPIDKLKIDREFIKGIPEDKDDIAITNAIINLASSLNLKIIAEGPETIEHIEFLKEAQCDIAQGYFYSKPISIKELEKLFN